MSNIKTIVVNNETYNIEDAVARNLLSEVSANLQNKVSKENGKSLISDTEISRLANVDNYDDTAIKSRILALENSEENNTGITYSDSDPSNISDGMTWIGN